MSNNAAEYADSLHTSFIARTDAGHPFGFSNEWNGEVANEDPRLEEGADQGEDSNWSEASAMDFITDSLDVEYVIGSDRKFQDGRIYIAMGGPTAWIDTEKRALVVTWMSEPEVRNLPAAFIDPISDTLEELWDMGA